MEGPIVTMSVQLNDVQLHSGEVVTVWLNTDKPHGRCVQVELRVTQRGNPEIFLDDRNMYIIKSFDNWYRSEAIANEDDDTAITNDRPDGTHRGGFADPSALNDPGDIPPELNVALERRFEEMCDENPRVYEANDDDLAQADYEDWQTLQGLASLAEYYKAVADEYHQKGG